MKAESEVAPQGERVVVHLRHGIIKGFVDTLPIDDVEALLSDETRDTPDVLRVRRLENDIVEEITVREAKAIFYVRSFDGDAARRDLHFHARARIMQAVWIRLEFIDGEVMEGLVDNTVRFVCDSGFYLRPTDPNSNNRLVYVVKSWVKDLRVLGLRDM